MVCWATGGPQQYSGRPLRKAHQHLLISAAEWEAFLNDFQQTLDKFEVPQAEQVVACANLLVDAEDQVAQAFAGAPLAEEQSP